jgi:formiminoglutamate deiminase
MIRIHARQALLPEGWASGVSLALEDGQIRKVAVGAAAAPGDERVGTLLPAMPNLHSHAFQRAMAGLAERRGPGEDTFWTWRETMYRFALSMTPDQMEAVAAQLYVEMLEAGFGRVGEFHYLHHDRDGNPYANVGEMAERIAAAAAETGIGLTLLPVFYAHSNFGGRPPTDGQRRFISDLDLYARLLETGRAAASRVPGANVGIAPHSLRAVAPDELAQLIPLAGMDPIHIHAAEQVREVEDCLAWSGARPVEWLLDNAPVDARWCLIHATHMTEAETDALARRGAVAGLCPVTEGNLGDGVFPAVRFLQGGGRFGIGSDSNVLIGVPEELRQLEYAQRLLHRQRTVLPAPNGSNGRALFEAALGGGCAALGAQGGRIAEGEPADLVSLALEDDVLEDRPGDAILDAWIFCGHARPDAVWVGGHKQVDGGRHLRREAVRARFVKAMRELASA